MGLATLVYERYLSARGARRRIWGLLRKALIRLRRDPACSIEVHGRRLFLPLSHALPLYLQQHRFYDRLPRRLGDFVRRRHGRLSCIDVGANVGDTVAAFHPHESDHFLAIEPNPVHNRLLRANWVGNPNVTVAAYVCSSVSDEARFVIREHDGTASVHASAAGAPMSRRALDDILTDAPAANTANVLKVDTDGHDFEVIAGAEQFLARNRPAVFMECDIFGNSRYVEDCLRTLDLFRRHGYLSFLAYDNFGNPMGRYSLADTSPFRSLLFYQLVAPEFHYFDLLFMTEDDLMTFAREETNFFVSTMPEESLRDAARRAAALP